MIYIIHLHLNENSNQAKQKIFRPPNWPPSEQETIPYLRMAQVNMLVHWENYNGLSLIRSHMEIGKSGLMKGMSSHEGV